MEHGIWLADLYPASDRELRIKFDWRNQLICWAENAYGFSFCLPIIRVEPDWCEIRSRANQLSSLLIKLGFNKTNEYINWQHIRQLFCLYRTIVSNFFFFFLINSNLIFCSLFERLRINLRHFLFKLLFLWIKRIISN